MCAACVSDVSEGVSKPGSHLALFKKYDDALLLQPAHRQRRFELVATSISPLPRLAYLRGNHVDVFASLFARCQAFVHELAADGSITTDEVASALIVVRQKAPDPQLCLHVGIGALAQRAHPREWRLPRAHTAEAVLTWLRDLAALSASLGTPTPPGGWLAHCALPAEELNIVLAKSGRLESARSWLALSSGLPVDERTAQLQQAMCTLKTATRAEAQRVHTLRLATTPEWIAPLRETVRRLQVPTLPNMFRTNRYDALLTCLVFGAYADWCTRHAITAILLRGVTGRLHALLRDLAAEPEGVPSHVRAACTRHAHAHACKEPGLMRLCLPLSHAGRWSTAVVTSSPCRAVC
jgi:hypothetical protein